MTGWARAYVDRLKRLWREGTEAKNRARALKRELDRRNRQ